MSKFLRVVWKSNSHRRVLSRRKKFFKAYLLFRHLKKVDITPNVHAAKSPGSPDLDMSDAGSSLHSSTNRYEDQDMQDEMENSPDSAIYGSTSDKEDELSNSNGYNMFDENDEWSYDANEALQVRDIEKEVDILSRKFEEQIISTREEQIERETFKLREKLISGWAEDTVELSLRLETRGLYPLMPMSWKSGFPFLGQHLFAEDPDEAYFSRYAKGSFQDVFKIYLVHGVQNMRTDCDVGFGDANCRLWRRVRTFIKCINSTAGLRNDIRAGTLVPLLVLKRCREGQTTAELAAAFMDEFQALTSRLLKALIKSPLPVSELGLSTFPTDTSAYITPPPTLFGIAIHRPIISVLAYEPLTHPSRIKEVAYLHTSSSSYEMWNVFGIAITAVHCRNNLLRIKNALQAEGRYVTPQIED